MITLSLLLNFLIPFNFASMQTYSSSQIAEYSSFENFDFEDLSSFRLNSGLGLVNFNKERSKALKVLTPVFMSLEYSLNNRFSFEMFIARDSYEGYSGFNFNTIRRRNFYWGFKSKIEILDHLNKSLELNMNQNKNNIYVPLFLFIRNSKISQTRYGKSVSRSTNLLLGIGLGYSYKFSERISANIELGHLPIGACSFGVSMQMK